MYYYIDPIRLVNSLKWRLHKLRHSIDNKTRDVRATRAISADLAQEIKTQGYFCPRCKRTYSTLDVGMLAFDEGGFYCDDCHARLDDNENAAERKANKKELERFQTQCRGVIEALRQTEGNVIFPSYVDRAFRRRADSPASTSSSGSRSIDHWPSRRTTG